MGADPGAARPSEGAHPGEGAPATGRWRPGNRVRLLENGDAYFPVVLEAIAAARIEVLVETFILAEDAIGVALREALLSAAGRGARVHLTVDGYGTPHLSPAFVNGLLTTGVRLQVHGPQRRFLGLRLNIMRRMHRKIVVVDRERAFVGGINFSTAHVVAGGGRAKVDYAVELTGPIVADIRDFARGAVEDATGDDVPEDNVMRRDVPPPSRGTADVLFLVRDNAAHRTDIECAYRDAIRSARREIVVANAFFVPGYRLLRDFRDAARRGVRVVLIVQGLPDQAYAIAATRRLYPYLAAAGVEILEYRARPFHGKVAVVDDTWATVGSTNLDPSSLAFNLEANVFVRDAAFQRELRARLDALTGGSSRIDPAALRSRPLSDTVLASLLFGFMRRYHGWAARIPHRRPEVAVLPAPTAPASGRAGAQRWRWIGKGLAALFFLAVALLLVRYARAVHWQEVGEALRSYQPVLLGSTVLLAALSYVLYASYDVLARAYTGHHLPVRRILAIACISYAFNLNLGSLVGGAAFRYRLYSRAGLDAATITRIIGFSVATNWLGYVALAGGIFAAGVVQMPEAWSLTHSGLRVLGVLLLLATIGYFVACVVFRDRAWRVRGHDIRLPSWRIASLQLLASAANWVTIGAILHQLLHGGAPYATVLGAMLLAAIAGAMTHIPAGLGVVEVVLLTALDQRLGHHTLLAALFAYRAIYYLGPMFVALIAYGRFEAIAGRRSHGPVAAGAP